MDACPICWNNDHLKKKKHIGAKVPIPSASFRDRFQFDLIDMGKQNKAESMNHYGVVMKWILHTKDHFTRLSHVVAIKSKEAKIIAFELNQLFSLIGCPILLHSDSEKPMVNSKEVINMLIELNPSMDSLSCSTIDTVTGRSRIPRDQGSVEKGNKFIKDVLNNMTHEQRLDDKKLQWPMLLPRVVSTMNASHSSKNISVHRTIWYLTAPSGMMV